MTRWLYFAFGIALAVTLATFIAIRADRPVKTVLHATCRAMPGFTPGTKMKLLMPAKYVHVRQPKHVAPGTFVSIGAESETFFTWAQESIVWEIDVPKAGLPARREFGAVFTIKGGELTGTSPLSR